MPRHALKPSPSLACLLRRRREELGLSARTVTTRSAELGERIPFPTLLRIEQGRQEPGVRRFYALLRLYDLPLEIVPDLLELDALAAEPPAITDPDALYTRGTALWREGQVGPALAHLFALRMLPASATDPLLRQKALLGFAVFANKIGRTELSHRLIERLLRDGPHESIRVYVLVQAAINWQNLGSRDMAAAVLQHARSLLRPGQHHEAALVEHETARQWIRAQDPKQALTALRQALRSYGAAGDHSGRCTALAVRVDALLQLKRPREAAAAAREGRREAQRRGFAMIAAARYIDEGRAQLAYAPAEAVTTLQAALGEAVALGNASIRFSGHYWLWKAFEATHQPERARIERDAACSSVRAIQDTTDEVREVRALVEKGGLHATRPMASPARRSRRRP